MDKRKKTRPVRRKRTPEQKAEAQVQYTPAKTFNRNRFLLRLATAAAVVLAVFAGMSIFFKVDENKILVSGAVKYTAYDVKEGSGLHSGDGLLGLSKAEIAARICKRLPYVDSVRVGIKLPDTVHIEIVERPVYYAVSDTMSNWWLVNVEGRIVDKADAAAVKSYTQILGVRLQGAVKGEQAVASEVAPTTPTDAALPVVSGKDRLSNALLVIKALENNGIMGNVNSIDVTDPTKLTLVYEDRFRINVGDNSKMDYKIATVNAAINERLGEYDQGYLDASYTIYPNEIKFDDTSDTKN